MPYLDADNKPFSGTRLDADFYGDAYTAIPYMDLRNKQRQCDYETSQPHLFGSSKRKRKRNKEACRTCKEWRYKRRRRSRRRAEFR